MKNKKSQFFTDKEEIKKWLDSNSIDSYTINDDLTVDAFGDVILFNKKLIKIPVQFNIVIGSFFCSSCSLTTLKGCPIKVKGSFYCSNNKLTSLEFCPLDVDDDFDCSYNQLNNLEYVPTYITSDFNCSFNQLSNLKYAPLGVGGEFTCNDNPFIDEAFNTMTSDQIKCHLKFDRLHTHNKNDNLEIIINKSLLELDEKPKKDFQWIDSNNVITDRGNIDFIKSLNGKYFKERLVIKDETIFDKLLNEFPNFKEVIDFYKAQFRLSLITNDTKIPPVLLLGAPGIGKTMFVKKLAEYIDTGFTFIDMGSASASFVLSGHSSSWHDSKHGKAFDAMLKSNTASPIILLDELEKSTTHDRNPITSLYQLLEETNSKAFVDEFVNFPTDLSKIIYIGSANSTTGLSEPLLTRFMVFDIPNPTPSEQAKILQSIYRSEIKNSPLFEDKLNDEIIEALINDSLRVAKIKINKAISTTLLNVDMSKIHDNKKSKIKINSFLFKEDKPNKKAIGF
ncbi:AAA family ATPase [Methylovorus glucosotrophus]|uniref:AAA ATPase central domain protein n=1 Tax=Methylovorus glucosotrophus (strain SIP3-4) TaxID=582744 RepID=C6X7U3_METGS|nr:AAA family ATPase [Methylovorus glucosotrophus]ACT51270.1 AAA ATPase central domain protein [Methylovorus glucosotrophus SIP3-4]